MRAIAIIGVLLLTSCGGGGSSGAGADVVVVPGAPTVPSTPTPSSTPTPTASAEQLEYERSNAAVAAQADAAYRAGATGRGVKIAVIDTGITPGLSEFSGRIDPASTDIAGNRGLTDLNGHGTATAAVALAARDGRGMHGIAFEASLLSLNASQSGNCTPQQCPLDSAAVARAIDAAVAAGVRVINMSFSSDEADGQVIDAVRRAAAAGIVMIISAGNQPGGVEPRLLSRAIADAGAGLVIIAGGHDTAAQSFAAGNRAGTGIAAASYLAALAADVATIKTDGSVTLYPGTSLPAAIISGAVALIVQARPQLTGAQIVSLLLDHATDAGAPGRDALFGRGILNIRSTFEALNAVQ